MLRKVSTLPGVISIIAVAVVLFGAVFAYQYFVLKAQPLSILNNNSVVSCSVLPYKGPVPFNQTDVYRAYADYPEILELIPDVRGGMVCGGFNINSRIPSITINFFGSENNTLVGANMTDKTGKIIQTISDLELDPIFVYDWPGVEKTVEARDLNFDGYNDIALMTEHSGSGNDFYSYFIYNPETGKFDGNKVGFPDGNLNKIDWQKKQISVFSKGGGCNWTEELYQLEKGRYVLIKKLISGEKFGLVGVGQKTYELQDGEMKLVSSRDTDYDNCWDDFGDL